MLELPGRAHVVSVITRDSAERLGLPKGKTVNAVIKASGVTVMTK